MILNQKIQIQKANNGGLWVEIPSTSCSLKPDNTAPRSFIIRALLANEPIENEVFGMSPKQLGDDE